MPDSYLVKNISLNIARYQLYKQMEGNDIPDMYKLDYEHAVALLEKFGEGYPPPPDADGNQPSARSGGLSMSLTSNDAIFKSDDMEVF